VQERTDEPDTAIVQGRGGDAGKSPARSARKTHLRGFGLIVGGVPKKNDVSASIGGSFDQQTLAGLTRSVGDACGRLGFIPAHRAVSDAKVSTEPGYLARFISRFRTQTMVHRHGENIELAAGLLL